MYIDRLVRFVLPRQDIFFALLEQIADRIAAGAEVFDGLDAARGHDELDNIARQLKGIEQEAEQLCHQVYQELDQTFVTPIDREDLATLTKALDDVIEGMEHAAAFAALFHFDELTLPMKQLVKITVRSARVLTFAVKNLRKFKDPEAIRQPAIEVNDLENEGDQVYRSAIEALFANGQNPLDLVRQKDMLSSLEDLIDQCRDAMGVIRSVVVKNG
jgi:Phosphate transport regulator (distant homolog of PhoU)